MSTESAPQFGPVKYKVLPFVWLLFESTKKPHLTQDPVSSLGAPAKE
jgi:hypothetical protein